MIRSVDFISKYEAQCLAPSDDVAVISITGALRIPLTLSGFYRVLPLEFQDVRQAGEMWAFNQKHAAAIIAFVEELHASPKEIDLMVHCKVGVSRSAAVSLYVAGKTGCAFARRDLAGGANRLVLQVLAKVEAGGE